MEMPRTANMLTPPLLTATFCLGQGPGMTQTHHSRIRFFFPSTSSLFSNFSCSGPFPQRWLRQDSEWMNQKGIGRERERESSDYGERRRWPSFGMEADSYSGKIYKIIKKPLNQTPKKFTAFLDCLNSGQLTRVIFSPSLCMNFLY